jgi:hypothetical protein
MIADDDVEDIFNFEKNISIVKKKNFFVFVLINKNF